MTADIGGSSSTYRSYEENARCSSFNVVAPMAKFLGLEVGEFLSLFASVVIFALRPAPERELVPQNGNSGVDGTTHVLHEVPSDGGPDQDGNNGVPRTRARRCEGRELYLREGRGDSGAFKGSPRHVRRGRVFQRRRARRSGRPRQRRRSERVLGGRSSCSLGHFTFHSASALAGEPGVE